MSIIAEQMVLRSNGVGNNNHQPSVNSLRFLCIHSTSAFMNQPLSFGIFGGVSLLPSMSCILMNVHKSRHVNTNPVKAFSNLASPPYFRLR